MVVIYDPASASHLQRVHTGLSNFLSRGGRRLGLPEIPGLSTEAMAVAVEVNRLNAQAAEAREKAEDLRRQVDGYRATRTKEIAEAIAKDEAPPPDRKGELSEELAAAERLAEGLFDLSRTTLFDGLEMYLTDAERLAPTLQAELGKKVAKLLPPLMKALDEASGLHELWAVSEWASWPAPMPPKTNEPWPVERTLLDAISKIEATLNDGNKDDD